MNLGARTLERATTDALFNGSLLLAQPTAGHRTTVDTLMLAAFARSGRAPRAVLDLGSGAGALALILHHFGVHAHFSLVDVSEAACSLARGNLMRAGIAGRVFRHDLSGGLPEQLRRSAELVVLNPPYFQPGSARAPRLASDTRVGSLQPFLRAARDGLGQRGRVAGCYPAATLETFLSSAAEVGLHAKRLRLVHPFADRPARLALIECKPGRGGGLCIEPPLVEWNAKSMRSAELSALIAGREGDPE
ncbi:MAG TPA: methyltransferase [Polyangiaceae bacterium]|nr:methyltransferase [Polyangiaceae bacterium]HMR78989.1 methyltransferase [Polyangiaceae bacterium]